jgi:hypothetical protein
MTHPVLPDGSLTTALAYISTNAAVTAGIYGTYLGLEKKWKKELFTGYKTPRVLQISMTVCYIFAVYMTVIALRTQIPNLINSFIGS